MASKKYQFELEFQVRDYELDMLGMVNNAVYQNYLEHSRHEYMKTIGIDFGEMYAQGYQMVVVRSEIDYRHTLRSGDSFVIRLRFSRESRVRFLFEQDLFLLPSEKPVLTARILGSCLNEKGRPKFPQQWQTIFERLAQEETLASMTS